MPSHQMKGKQARRQGVSVSVSFRCSVSSAVRRACHPRFSWRSRRVRRRLVPVITSKQAKRQEETRQGQDERQRGAAEAWRSRRSHHWIVSQRANENKQARRERLTTSPIPISSHGQRTPSHAQSINLPAHTTSKHETRKRDAGTTGDDGRARRTRRRRGERRNENARAPQDDKQVTRRQTRRPARRERDDETHDDNGKSKQSGAKRGEREEQNGLFSNLSPDPLSPILSHPSASIIPPPPRAWDERAVKQTRHAHLPSVASAGFYHSRPAPHPLSLAAYSHLRRHLSARAVLGSSSIRAAIGHAPQDARAKRPPPPLIMASIKRPAHSTSRTRRRTERGEWRAVHDRRLDRCLDRRCSRCPPPPHRISPAWFPS